MTRSVEARFEGPVCGARGAGIAARLAIGALLCAMASAAPPRAVEAAVVNRILATVDGQPITQHQLDAFIRTNIRGADPDSVGEADRRRVLDVLINDLLVEMESQSAGVGPGKEEIDAYIEQIKRRNNLSDERLLEALEAQGLTVDAYREQVRKELQRSALLNRQVRSRVNVSPEEIERYYEQHADEFQVAESVRVRHLFFPIAPETTPAQAEAAGAAARAAYERLRSGEDFDQVARDAERGPARGIGGDLGTMRKGQMIPELEEVAFRLKEGESSPPLASAGGIHILRVDQRSSSGAADIEKVREQIKEKLYGSAVEERYQRWVEEDLRKSHEIVIK